MARYAKFRDTTFSVGDIIRVAQEILEEGKKRTITFQGMVIAISGRGENKTFTVRKIGTGKIGIERIFPLNLPTITKIEVVKKTSPKRAKLYYLRERK